jgi:hypothetical protein
MPEYPAIDGPLPSNHEGADWGVDPDSGARVLRLTSMPAWSHNIYCEQPYASPDGQRVLIGRTLDPFAQSCQLIVADLGTLGLTLVEPDAATEAVAHTSWGEWAYYQMRDGSLRRLSLLTLERQAVLPAGSLAVPPKGGIQSITPDDRWLIGYEPGDGVGLRTYALDLHTGQRQVVCQGPENLNPHAQADLGPRRRCLHQLIRRGETIAVPVLVYDLETGRAEYLPFGGEHSAESSGHMAWVGQTGRVACAMNWLREQKRHDPRHPEGNLLIAAPGDARPTVFPAPNHGFYHVSISRCGRYFVCDDFMDFRSDAMTPGSTPPGPTRIVVGNLDTGKSRVLIRDCQDYGIAGSSRFEPTPYFTADNRHVIYNGSPFGTMQVFAAQVPAGFLGSLA